MLLAALCQPAWVVRTVLEQGFAHLALLAQEPPEQELPDPEPPEPELLPVHLAEADSEWAPEAARTASS